MALIVTDGTSVAARNALILLIIDALERTV
jgi:hypothetical protein